MRFTAAVAVAAAVGLAAGCGGASSGAGGPLQSASPTGTSATGTTPTPTCTPAGGSRCPGPQPISGSLTVDASGRHLTGVFLCGGQLSARETADRVTVTYIASAVRRGGMACARVPLVVTLQQPLGNRTVVDGANGQTVTVTRSR